MKYRRLGNAGLFVLFLLLFAAPAFAQFEVSPDHFDDQPAAKTKQNAEAKKKSVTHAGSSSQAAGAKANHANTNASALAKAAKPKPGRKTAGSLVAARKRSSGAQKAASSKSSGLPTERLKTQAANVHRQ